MPEVSPFFMRFFSQSFLRRLDVTLAGDTTEKFSSNDLAEAAR
jgi:hypothetical protein